jgi:hypothetical protein
LRADGRNLGFKKREIWGTQLVRLGLVGAARPCSKLAPFKPVL